MSPAICTGLMADGGGAVWVGLLCLGSLGTIAIGARLRHHLTPGQDGVQVASVATKPAPAAQQPATVLARPQTPCLDPTPCLDRQ